MSDKIAISVKNVSKNFRLPHQKTSSIKDVFVRPLQTLRGGKNVEVQHALKDISFDVKEGEFFGIVGRNGSGKSTLLKILAEIYQPSKGEVSVKGRLVPFIELGVGFNPELTGRENVYLSGALNGFSEKEVDEMYEDIVEFAELEAFMDQKLKNYSSGMQVRLAFSVATRAKADILLIDEVLAVGDADFQRKCFSYFKKLKKDKKTVVFVSHDMNAVREYCDKAILIDDSKLIFSGSSDDTAKEYTRLFLPSENDSETTSSQKSDKWGAGGIDIYNVQTSKRIYNETDTFIEAFCRIKPKKDYQNDELVVGLSIRDEQGHIICGTNSDIVKYSSSISLSEGEILVTWRVPNFFNEGTFTIDMAVDSKDRSELLQWWEEATEFKVINEEKTPYLVAPKISLDVKG